MLRIGELTLPLDHTDADLRAAIAARLRIAPGEITSYGVAKRSADARGRRGASLVYAVDVETPREAELLERFGRDPRVRPTPDTTYRYVARAPEGFEERPIVIGMGPCGLFAALVLAEMGFRPLLLERGKAVRERTVDTFGFWRQRRLDPESNVQFGEGGAGTFSDGKLYSRIKDPAHRGRKVLRDFVEAGAPEEILYAAKPHIGTFKLVKMVESMRAKIVALGGEIRFGTRGDDLLLETTADGGRRVAGVALAGGAPIRADRVVLAVGHSARDTFEMLLARGVAIEPKPFSIGVRIEHPQALIDRCRWGPDAGHPALGAADYQLVHHCENGRTVYSFCMCPGGTVVAAASEAGGVVTNGMSQYDRSERNANSGLVVSVTPEDYPGGPLAGIAFQREWEQRAFEVGGGTYDAPAQTVRDFLAGRPSTALGSVEPSYRPGIRLTDLALCLPAFAVTAIREALPAFERQMPGYAMPDALMTAVETRTSAPIRIPRGESLESVNTAGLYPAGEGAGYAGGILSAAVDGIRVAEAVGLAMVARANVGAASQP